MLTNLNALRWVGWVEALSFLLLLGIAMPLKYMSDQPLGVRILGPIHGFLFIVFGIQAALCYAEQKIDGKLAGLCLVGALLPFGPLLYHKALGQLANEGAEPVKD